MSEMFTRMRQGIWEVPWIFAMDIYKIVEAHEKYIIEDSREGSVSKLISMQVWRPKCESLAQNNKLDMVACICSLGTGDSETGRFQGLTGQPT